MNESKDAIMSCESQVEDFKNFFSYEELMRIDGEAIDFEWCIFQGFSSIAILQEIQTFGEKEPSNPKSSRVGSEKKWYGTLLYTLGEYQCFESWNSEKEEDRDTTHFHADASNIELLVRIIL